MSKAALIMSMCLGTGGCANEVARPVEVPVVTVTRCTITVKKAELLNLASAKNLTEHVRALRENNNRLVASEKRHSEALAACSPSVLDD